MRDESGGREGWMDGRREQMTRGERWMESVGTKDVGEREVIMIWMDGWKEGRGSDGGREWGVRRLRSKMRKNTGMDGGRKNGERVAWEEEERTRVREGSERGRKAGERPER